MKNYIYYLTLFILTSCTVDSNFIDYKYNNSHYEKTENNNETYKNKNLVTNYDLITKSFNEFKKTEEFQNRSSYLYYCSEENGTYTSYSYLNEGYYLNNLYAPPGSPNLMDFLNQKYHNNNASGSKSISISISFDIYGVENPGYLNTIEANRVYNEFLCQLQEATNINNPKTIFQTLIKYNLEIQVDYMLCCTGTSCCFPILSAIGTAYYD